MSSPSEALLARYLAGECSATEAREVERWVERHAANRARLDELRAIWQARRPSPDWDVEAMWGGVRRSMHANRARSVRFGPAPGSERRSWWKRPIMAAAVLVLVGGSSLFLLHSSPDTTPNTTADSAPMREYATPRGQRATFQLSDGTRLVLAPESRLRVPADYGRAVREVYLEGEGFFEVTHDSTRPFRVLARDAVAEDLGTRFDVRAYPEDDAVAVAVAEGAVALGRASPTGASPSAEGTDGPQGVVLRRGELGTLASDGRVTTATGAVVATYLAWADGRLHFVDTPLPEVAHAVGRWFDIELRLQGENLESRTLTADFAAQSSEELLHALALAVGARVTRSGAVVTLHSRP